MKYLSIIAYASLFFSCCGWGSVLTRRAAIRDQDSFAFLAVVGIACLMFLGGLLNLFRIAYPAALGILLLLGLIFLVVHYSANAGKWLTAWRASGSVNPEKSGFMSGRALPVGILVIAVVFYAVTLLPSTVMNYHDDFYTYIPRPLRMLQTGTLAGNPFDVLGLDSLGSHAFLQGFVLLGFPIEYLPDLDAVFSFALAGWLLIAIGKKFNLHWSYTAISLLGFIVINPQSVNASPLYLGAAMILGILYASFRLLDQMEKSGSDTIPINAAGILGLLLAGLIGLKTTFVSYALAYFFIFFTGLLLISKDKRRILKTGSLVMLCALVTILPWLLLHAANYASAVHAALHRSAATPVNQFSALRGDLASLFTAHDLFYGGSVLSYGIIVLMLAVLGIYSLFNTLGNRGAPPQRGYLLVAVSSSAAGFISYIFFGSVFPPDSAIRYSCPILIAVLPFAWLAAAMTVSGSLHPARSLMPGIETTITLSMPLLVIILFWSNFVERVERAYNQHTTISFPVSNSYLEYSRYAISSDARQDIRSIQDKTQPGQKILAWIPLPMYLDYSRNEIYSINNGGLLNPWLDMPLNGNANDMVQYLKGQGIRYILWDYKGKVDLEASYRRWLSSPFPGYRKTAERGMYLRRMLAAIMTGGSLLYDANGTLLFDLQQIKD